MVGAMMADMFSVLAEINAAQLAIIAVLTFVGSVAAGLSGMGGGILIAIAITPVIGVKALIPTIAVTMMINHVARVWVFRRGVKWLPAVLFTAVLFVGISLWRNWLHSRKKSSSEAAVKPG